MGMVNIKTPADTFCKQFFTYFLRHLLRSKKSFLHVSQLLSLQNPSSLYPVFHHKIIDFSLRANGIFLAVFWIQKALGILALTTHLSPQD